MKIWVWSRRVWWVGILSKTNRNNCLIDEGLQSVNDVRQKASRWARHIIFYPDWSKMHVKNIHDYGKIGSKNDIKNHFNQIIDWSLFFWRQATPKWSFTTLYHLDCSCYTLVHYKSNPLWRRISSMKQVLPRMLFMVEFSEFTLEPLLLLFHFIPPSRIFCEYRSEYTLRHLIYSTFCDWCPLNGWLHCRSWIFWSRLYPIDPPYLA